MQYQKAEVRERILAAARKEYLAHGFHGGNISNIAAEAGVPVGNLYRYFKGKEGILDAIVKPAYENLPKLMNDLQQIAISDTLTPSQTMQILGNTLLEFCDAYGDNMLILTDCCRGTRYEDFSDYLNGQVARVLENKLYGSADDMQTKFVQIVSKAFCGSLFDVLRMHLGHEQKQEMLERNLKFYFYEVDKRK